MTETASDAASTPELTRLPSGEELQGEELNAVASAHPCRLIVIGGEPESGKTTLLAAIFEQFRVSSFAGFLFAGSRTLPAFERRCYLSRIASGRSTPETERTRAGTLSFLHLGVRNVATGQRCDLLLSDISGEDFAAARDSTIDAQRLQLISSASRFVLLIDAAACRNPRTRHSVLSNSRLLMSSLLKAAVVTPDTDVDVVLTKLDVLDDASKEEIAFANSVLEKLSAEFSPRVHKLNTHKIAARPATVANPLNVAELLQSWCEPDQSRISHYIPDNSTLNSPFDRFDVVKENPRDGDE